MSYQYITTKKIDQLDTLFITHPKFDAQITLFGAQILSFIPAGETDVLWLSDTAQLSGDRPIRGGAPLCWPWFGPATGIYEGEPQHGYVRNVIWQLKAVEESEDKVILRLSPILPQPLTEKLGLQLEVTYEFSDALNMTMNTQNISQQERELSQAIHSYFALDDIKQSKLLGLKDSSFLDKLTNKSQKQTQDVILTAATDRVYLNHESELILESPNRSLLITGQGHDSVVVWNPWQDGAKVMADFDDLGYLNMMCVEMANTQSLVLSPGESHSMTQTVNIKKPA